MMKPTKPMPFLPSGGMTDTKMLPDKPLMKKPQKPGAPKPGPRRPRREMYMD